MPSEPRKIHMLLTKCTHAFYTLSKKIRSTKWATSIRLEYWETYDFFVFSYCLFVNSSINCLIQCFIRTGQLFEKFSPLTGPNSPLLTLDAGLYKYINFLVAVSASKTLFVACYLALSLIETFLLDNQSFDHRVFNEKCPFMNRFSKQTLKSC